MAALLAGQKVPASVLETRLAALETPALSLVRQTVAQSIPTATFTPVTFDAETYDTPDGHSITVNISRYTCQKAGWYQLSGVVVWAPNATGRRLLQWRVGGTAINGGRTDLAPVGGGVQTAMPASTIPVLLAVGNYVELAAFQDTGSPLSTAIVSELQSYMAVLRISS
jgi:hypothetical protein